MSFVSQYKKGVFSVLGSFSKGIAGSASLNFGVSGGANCSKKCRHHPEHPAAAASPADLCYAFSLEQQADRVQLADKLARHETLPASLIVGRAQIELEREELYQKPARPWFRFSTNGSLPGRVKALRDRQFIARLRSLLETINRRMGRGRCHLPVETAEKAAFYRETVGDLVTVRESIQTLDMRPSSIKNHPIPVGPVSFTAGADVADGPDKYLRVLAAAAAAAAAWSARTGRKTIVCPAVRVSFLSRLKAYRRGRSAEQVKSWRMSAKCGSCRACALPQFDIVYPAHGKSAALPIINE